jgi:hypothetical protein
MTYRVKYINIKRKMVNTKSNDIQSIQSQIHTKTIYKAKYNVKYEEYKIKSNLKSNVICYSNRNIVRCIFL